MRVVQELLDYLVPRGFFSEEEVRRLIDRGLLLDAGYLGFDRPPKDPRKQRKEAPDPLDAITSLAKGSAGKGKRGGRKDNKRKALTAQEIARLLPTRFREWETDLSALCIVARRLKPVSSWMEAALTLVKSQTDVIVESTIDAFRKGDLTAKRLWTAVAFDGYERCLPPEATQQASNAYRVLLYSTRRSDMGSFGWILKAQEFRDIHHLLNAQRLLLGACDHLVQRESGLLTRAFKRGCCLELYWLCTVLYSARRIGGMSPHPSGEHKPMRRELEIEKMGPVWRFAGLVCPDLASRLWSYLHDPLSPLAGVLPERSVFGGRRTTAADWELFDYAQSVTRRYPRLLESLLIDWAKGRIPLPADDCDAMALHAMVNRVLNALNRDAEEVVLYEDYIPKRKRCEFAVKWLLAKIYRDVERVPEFLGKGPHLVCPKAWD